MCILADSGASGLQAPILDDLTDLGTQNESSGACLRANFGYFGEKCERFLKKSNFEIKKLRLQSLNFLSKSFILTCTAQHSCPAGEASNQLGFRTMWPQIFPTGVKIRTHGMIFVPVEIILSRSSCPPSRTAKDTNTIQNRSLALGEQNTGGHSVCECH